MPRIRTIKPEFFRHEVLQDLERDNPNCYPMLVFAGLFVVADKGGRFEWKPRTLKLDILPFLDFDMESTLSILAESQLIESYEAEGKKYGLIPTFSKHQRITGKEANLPNRYPDPSCLKQRGNIGETPLKHRGNTGETSGKHPDAQEREKEKEREKERKKGECATIAAAPQASPVILLPLHDGTEHPITDANLAEWQKLYPGVDVLQQLRSMRGWLLANPKRRKTRQGIQRFVVAWLAREQDRGCGPLESTHFSQDNVGSTQPDTSECRNCEGDGRVLIVRDRDSGQLGELVAIAPWSLMREKYFRTRPSHDVCVYRCTCAAGKAYGDLAILPSGETGPP